jgi:hypothetical protein
MSAVVGSQYEATAGAAESLRAQRHFQGKLTMPRRENWKIWHKNEILNANEHAPHVYKLQVYRLIPKKHTTKSRETIPLNQTAQKNKTQINLTPF